MTTFDVYQIDALTHKAEAVDAMMGVFQFTNPKQDGLKLLLDQLQTGIYEKVATVEALNNEHAFELMNIWPGNEADYIKRFKPLHSLSVGDILVNRTTNGAFVVATFGFNYLGNYIAGDV